MYDDVSIAIALINIQDGSRREFTFVVATSQNRLLSKF